MTKVPRRSLLLISILLIAHKLDPIHANNDPSADFFCGTTWTDAFNNCNQPCPSQSDSECTQAGHTCHGYTGCAAKGIISSNPYNIGLGNSGGGGGADDPYKNNMCGISWLTAMLSCSTPCPPGTDCPGGQTCFAATNCDKPIEPIVSKMIMSLLGDYPGTVNLGSTERGVFSESVLAFLAEKMEENKVAINGADVTGQSFMKGYRDRGRRLMYWNDTSTGSFVSVELSVEQRRRLPTSSSALDVSMTITGEYRPPPYQDIDILIEDSINRASQRLVTDVRDRGSRSGTQFFERVEGMAAVRVAEATQRPTRSPTDRPTNVPTEQPTKYPTQRPTVSPTVSPSTSPTRAWEQVLQTGSGTDLYENTARSFGNLFEVKTKPGAETVLIKGIDFYSAAINERVSYEVWTKEGSWQGFEGKLESFEKIAEGALRSRGACDETTAANCKFAQIPFDQFTNVPIRGGGGSRSFYITLTEKQMMYRQGQATSNTDFSVQMETPDIEIYEGAGVIVYPFSDATEEQHYRKPRGFLGNIWYDRNPCEDGSMDWPCQTRSPVTEQQLRSSKPTQKPTPYPTMKPTSNPTNKPIQQSPTYTPPPSLNPTLVTANTTTDKGETPTLTSSPDDVIEYSYDEADVTSTNIVLTVHNVPDRIMDNWEEKKYNKVLLEFLRSQPSLQAASVDAFNITVWHQVVVTEDGKNRGKGKRPVNSDSRDLQGNSTLANTAGADANTTEADTSNEAGDELSAEGLLGMALGMKIPEVETAIDGTKVPIDITTIIKTANSVLPSDVTGVLLLHVIKENSTLLVDLLRAELFQSYFQDASDVSGRIIDDVTDPPSSAPTTLSQMIASSVNIKNNNEEENDGERMNIITMLGFVTGVLWGILTLYSICHLLKARNEMKNERLLRNNGQTNQKEDQKLNKEMSHKSVFDSFHNADEEHHSGDTNVMEDFCSSNESKDFVGFHDEEEGSVDHASPAQTASFADIFPCKPTNSGEKGQGEESTSQLIAPTKHSTFNDRLKKKLSASNAGAQPESAPVKKNGPNFDDRLKKKLSASNAGAQPEKKNIPNFDDRLKNKLSGSVVGAQPEMKNRPNFDDRLKNKLSASVAGAQPEKKNRSSFDDRLKNKLSASMADAQPESHNPPGQKGNTFDDRLKRKVSSQNNAVGPKTIREEEKKEVDDEFRENPMMSLMAAFDTSKQDSSKNSDAGTKSSAYISRKQHSIPEKKKASSNRRRSDEGPSDMPSSKPEKNRRASLDDPLFSVISDSSLKSVEKRAEGNSSKKDRRRSSTSQASSKTKKERKHSKPDKYESRKKISKDHASQPSSKPDMGSNMIEMLFA